MNKTIKDIFLKTGGLLKDILFYLLTILVLLIIIVPVSIFFLAYLLVKLFKLINNYPAVVTSIATVILAVVTGLLWFETRNLVKADLEPIISISNACFEITDDGETPVRRWCWVEGETINNMTVRIGKATLSIKLRNTGKTSAIVSIKEINFSEPDSDKIIGKFPNVDKSSIIIPGQGETGLFAGLQFGDEVYFNRVRYNYNLDYDYYDNNMPGKLKTKNLKFGVMCNFRIDHMNKFAVKLNPVCWPSEYR